METLAEQRRRWQRALAFEAITLYETESERIAYVVELDRLLLRHALAERRRVAHARALHSRPPHVTGRPWLRSRHP